MRTLKDLTDFVEEEAAAEGPAAQAELQAQRDRFRIARELALLRKAQGLTQAQLSARAGVPQSEISKIESGKANATGLTLFRMAHAMGHAFRLEPVASVVAPRRSGRSVAAKKGRTARKRATRSRELEPA
ncbi:XRE family transcriptional regulator [Corallococcus exercitus]|uniref:Helix-turn-helix transcriptional regulator n=1 Tax=Corallococcus exercitus TaxID=2316736 RepID=A0A3A8I7T0_9BACT|nr:helix-turn-helix transcriptional regulator [Corallococcus exercitus]NOK31626.1 helix-turn-helix transcriptional regulator [Corallococcus exercitus]RKG78628.1 XRE family transcriptional regulator [Corallococcus exercitus]